MLKSAKDAFADLGKSMLKVIAQYFAKQAAGIIMRPTLWGRTFRKKKRQQALHSQRRSFLHGLLRSGL